MSFFPSLSRDGAGYPCALGQRFECVTNTPEEETGFVELELADESIIAERPSRIAH
jgi:hypothetical protein